MADATPRRLERSPAGTKIPEAQARPRIGAERRDVEAAAAITKVVSRQVLICVGGKGLAALSAMAEILKRAGRKFGDVVEVGGQQVAVDAIYVDADTGSTGRVRDEGLSKQDETIDDGSNGGFRELIENLRGMNVRVCDLYDRARDAKLIARGLKDQLVPGIPAEEDAQGAKANPSVGRVKWVVARENSDPKTNPLVVVKNLMADWKAVGAPFLDKEAWLTFIGGADGGTGPAALYIMADVRQVMEEALRGSTTQLRTERYMMTAENAGLDRARQEDGNQRRRMLNSAASVIEANAADVRQGVQIVPGEIISGRPSEFTFLVNGANAHRQVPPDDGHYTTSRMLGKYLALRALGLDPARVGRSNAGHERSEGTADPTAPNEPQAIFDVLGMAELVPNPDRAELTVQKRKYLFTAATGLDGQNEIASQEQVGMLLPDNRFKDMIAAIEYPRLRPAAIGGGERAKTLARRTVANLDTQVNADLPAAITRALIEGKNGIQKLILDALKRVKRDHGLLTAIDFLTKARLQIEALAAVANQMLMIEYSDRRITALVQARNNALTTVESAPLSGFDLDLGIFQIKGKTKRLTALDEKVTDLATQATTLAEACKIRMALGALPGELSTPLITAIDEIMNALKDEMAVARSLLAANVGDESLRSERTPFDVPTTVNLVIKEDPDALRREYLNGGGWTREALENLMQSIRVSADDIGLTANISDAVLEALDRLSEPLMVATTIAGEKPARTSSYVVTVPAGDPSAAEKVRVPDGSSRVAIADSGPYMAARECHGVSAMVDDRYTSECIRALLATPPTFAVAKQLRDTAPTLEGARDLLNREGQFTFKGVAETMLSAVFLALAKRQFAEAGRKGEIVEACGGQDCGVAFYRTAMEAGMGGKFNFCPGCRPLHT